jgi:hypothetical protein
MAREDMDDSEKAIQLFRDILEKLRGHDIRAIRLVLAMVFEAVGRKSAMPLPEALEMFRTDVQGFHNRSLES